MTIPKICIKCDNFQNPVNYQQGGVSIQPHQIVSFGESTSRLRCRYGADYETQARITGNCKHLNSKTNNAKSKTILRQIGISGEAPKKTVDIQQEILETLMAIDDKLRVLVGRP